MVTWFWPQELLTAVGQHQFASHCPVATIASVAVSTVNLKYFLHVISYLTGLILLIFFFFFGKGISRQEENFKACLGLELRADDDVEASLRVSCFQFGPKGLATMEAEPLPANISDDDDDDEDDDDDDPLGLGECK